MEWRTTSRVPSVSWSERDPRGGTSWTRSSGPGPSCSTGLPQARSRVRDHKASGEFGETSVGRIIFNGVLPEELGFCNEVMDKRALRNLVADCHQRLGNEATADVVDQIKHIGFQYCTKSGITIAINDLKVPAEKVQLLDEADARIAEIEEQFNMGLITEEERYNQAVAVWTESPD